MAGQNGGSWWNPFDNLAAPSNRGNVVKAVKTVGRLAPVIGSGLIAAEGANKVSQSMSPTAYAPELASRIQTGNIADSGQTNVPNVNNLPNNSLVSAGGDGSGGTQYQDTTASRNATQTSINSLDEILNNALAKITGTYDNIVAGYDQNDAQNETAYQTQKSANENNRQQQHQNALLSAAQGGRGLRATLASLGALGGTGSLLANRAISDTANADIGAADKTFDTNATTLSTADDYTKADQLKRRQEAADAKAGEESAARNDSLTLRQNLLKDMSGFWGKAGNNAQADNYMGQASSLTPQIASNTRAQVTPYKATDLAYNAGQLQNYLGGAKNMAVQAGGGQSGAAINSPLFATTRKRDDLS